jgi:hypothetical protein
VSVIQIGISIRWGHPGCIRAADVMTSETTGKRVFFHPIALAFK